MYNYSSLTCLLFVNKFGVECSSDIPSSIRTNGEPFITCFTVALNTVTGSFDRHSVTYHCMDGNNLWSDRRAIAADRICPGVTGQTLCYLTTELGSTRPGLAPFTSIKRFGACSHKENDGRGCPKEK